MKNLIKRLMLLVSYYHFTETIHDRVFLLFVFDVSEGELSDYNDAFRSWPKISSGNLNFV